MCSECPPAHCSRTLTSNRVAVPPAGSARGKSGRRRELLETKGWAQTELGEQAEVRRATIIRIERGPAKSIDLAVLEKLADALGVDPALLISHQRSGTPFAVAMGPAEEAWTSVAATCFGVLMFDRSIRPV